MNFKTLPQLLDYFKDEATCRAYLEQQLWEGNPACPFCGALNPYRTNRGFKCREKQCHKKFTVIVGTMYENTKIPLRIWFAAVYLCTAHKKGVSSCQLARDLGITQKTAWFVLHRIREMLKAKAPVMLKEEVQVDEVYIGGRESNKHANKKFAYKTGKAAQGTGTKAPVIGLYQKGGHVITHAVPFVTKRNVAKLILTGIAKDSIMVTDSLNVYNHLNRNEDYKHIVVNHLKGEYVSKDGFHTNGIENFWSHLRRSIYGCYHSVSTWHLQAYCNETAHRYNTRNVKDTERFNLTLQLSRGRLKYKELISR